MATLAGLNMGVIQRQTIKNNLVSFLAVALGALAHIYIYPEETDLKGQADAIFKAAFLLGPFIGFGAHIVMVRFLPYVVGDRVAASQKLLTRALAFVTVNLAILALLNFLLGDYVVEKIVSAGRDLGVLENQRWYVFALLVPVVYSLLITTHVLNFHRIAIPALFNNLFAKVLVPIAFFLAINHYYPLDAFLGVFIGIYWLILFCLIGYAWWLGVFRLRWDDLELSGKTFRDMISMGGYTLFGGIGSALATHLDTMFVNVGINNDYTTYYTFCVFATSVMVIPSKAVMGIASPIVSKAWKDKNMEELRMLYRETASVLFCVGMYIFVGLVACIPFVYQFSSKLELYAVGYTAVILLGIGQLVDLMTSINGTLITFTDSYRWSAVFIGILGCLNIGLNYYFMSTLQLGLTGAALATAISLIAYNVLKVLFVYRRMGLHPLSGSIVSSFLLGGVALIVALQLSTSLGPLANILLRGSVITLIFFLVIRFTGAVPILRRVLRGGLKNMFQ